MAEPAKRRRRPAVSCVLCRQRKIRCNREVPCHNCLRSKDAVCVYETQHPHGPPLRQRLGNAQPTVLSPAAQSALSVRQAPDSNQASIAGSEAAASDTTRPSSPHDIRSIERKIKALEEELANAKKRASQQSHFDIEDSCLAPPVQFRYDCRLFDQNTSEIQFRFDNRSCGQVPTASRTVFHKTRLFGQSHWMNSVSLLREIFAPFDPRSQENTSKVLSGLKQCKLLGKTIKSLRTPSWPCPPTPDLPSRDIADKLVDCYLQSTETIYRVLHIPSFKRDYEAIWTMTNESNTGFMVLLKLVLAIGATTYDEQFTLRPSAIRWTYEAQTWASHPEFKSHLNIPFLQINILLMIARELINVGDDLVWIQGGALMRTARYMGLHRDPAHLPKTSMFVAELRRRLWNTILELSLQSSLNSGGSPFISLDDFDIEPPGNFDDEQLEAEDPVPKPASEFTQMSIPIQLRNSFPLRLSIVRFLNDLNSSGAYEEVIRLDTGMKVFHKEFRHTLHEWMAKGKGYPSSLTLGLANLLTHRYVLSLHIPFFGLAMQQSAYTYSRKIVLDTSLKVWHTIHPSSPTKTISQFHYDTSSSYIAELARLTKCGSGFFRIVCTQATVTVAAEVKTQILEEDGFGLGLLRPDLLSILSDVKSWGLQCLESGETNMKGYLFHCLVAAHIDALMRSTSKEYLSALMIRTAEEASEVCIPILERKAAEARAENSTPGLNELPLDTPEGLGGDWNFITDNTFFNFADMEQMNWTFNEGVSLLPTVYSEGVLLLPT